MTSIKFSPLIAGTMKWGEWGKKYNTEEMQTVINCCLENNISSFDHADIYGDYSTEAAFGKAFNEMNLDRQKVQFISKCGIQLLGGLRKNIIKHYDYSAAYIINSVEQSLKNLHTEYLDLFLLHRPSPLMHADEIAEAINKLKQDGKILSFGLSNFSPSQTALINQKITVEYNQIEFSITHLDALQNGSFDYMQINNIRPMCWSPLGVVFTKTNEQTAAITKVMGELSEKYNAPAEVILLAWILRHPANILPVFGTADTARINCLMKATTIQMDLKDWFALWEAGMGEEVA